MKAYLIDPAERTVSEVDYDGDYKSIYRLLGIELFTVVELNDKRDVVYVDDEGLLTNPVYFFTVKGYEQPLAGKGLVLGTDGDGDTVEPTLTLAEVEAMVGWKRLTVMGFQNWEGWNEHPVFGKTWVVRSTPMFKDRDEPEQDKPFTVGRNDGTVSIKRFTTHDEAATYIGSLRETDAKGVDDGEYYLDGPEELVNPQKDK